MIAIQKYFTLFLFLTESCFAFSQTPSIKGIITSSGKPVEGATVTLLPGKKSVITDGAGSFQWVNILPGDYKINITAIGFQSVTEKVTITEDMSELHFDLQTFQSSLNEVVVTGTLKPVLKLASPVPVEVYTTQFLRKNPTPSIFEALQNVNGVRPQINCNVCNTGDIHINGLEGPYTMITIDGMPIVSSLSTVYGLYGIPNQLIDRIEIVKGPASGLYGSEAVGGLINIITKNPAKAPLLSVDMMATSWGEYSADLGTRFKVGKNVYSLLGINYFQFGQQQDKNNDNFTDLTNQHRISIFNKWSWQRPKGRLMNIAARYFYEDRWGGDIRWNKNFRGGDSLYGESIYTARWELLGNYQLPTSEKILFSFSYNNHDQNSYYGKIPYFGKQQIAFGQLTWDKTLGKHDLLLGAALRYTYYDDNSTATMDTLTGANKADNILLPGIFLQDEIKFNEDQTLLLGARYDHHSVHGNIFTPRVAYKWNINSTHTVRLNAGTGFRVVNLFTEDHAALTGARDVVITESLNPEQSYNVNLNYTLTIPMKQSFLGVDAAVWYTHFTNQIMADYDTDPNKIIYANLDGYAISRGLSINIDYNLRNRLKIMMGTTLQNVSRTRKEAGKNITTVPVLVEKWSGTWGITYSFPKSGLTIDYTGNLYGPMRLPLTGDLDPRSEYSPVWSIQNIQLTKKFSDRWEVYGGIKNLLNWTPSKSNPFIIARSNDPFDKQVQYGTDGKVLQTPDNPYALTFDPSYVYGPNQGMRAFLGFRFTVSGKGKKL